MSTEQTSRTFSCSMQRDSMTHVAKCSSSQSIVRGKAERADYWKKQRDTICSPHPNMRHKEWRNSFTKNTPRRVKLKLNIIAVKRKQENTMQWHQFPGVPGILLATLSRQCLHALTPPSKILWNKKTFPYKQLFVSQNKNQAWGHWLQLTLHQYLATILCISVL